MKNFKLKENITNRSDGFTLFVAMIVTTLILAIGLSIGNIILKELALSSSGRRSQIAFYAADSMAECALYWDKKDSEGYSVDNSALQESPFATSTNDDPFIQCGTGVGMPTPNTGKIANFQKVVDANNLNATSSFVASFSNTTEGILACGEVTIAKNGNNTVIEARGSNVGYSAVSGGCDLTKLRTVERGIKVEY